MRRNARHEVRGLARWRSDVRRGRALIALSLAACAALAACGPGEPAQHADTARDAAARPARGPIDIRDVLARGDVAGFERVLAPPALEFPRDHGAHETFGVEWWYVTANLVASDGREFGVQATWFRNALRAGAPARESAWGTTQLWLAHFAITDVAGGRHVASERRSRGAVGLAGAQASPFRVWVEDWSMESRGAELLPLVVRARDAGARIAVDLELAGSGDAARPNRSIVLHGERGMSRKGARPGNASCYYSLTRLSVRGVLEIDGAGTGVRGEAWLDREWSTSVLEPDQVGWDWFALQLDDGRELMLYELRRADGTRDPFGSGTLVLADGRARPLGVADFAIEVRGAWRSGDGVTYPSGWRVVVPSEQLDLRVDPLVADQEIALTFRYWEGAVRVAGTSRDRAVGGKGYVELTGYR